jgi:hypothetical protein
VLLVNDDGLLQIAAYVGKAHEAVAATFPAPVDITPAGRAIRERRVAQYPDVLNDPETPRVLRRMGQIVGYHSVAFAPMVWEGQGIGAVGVARSRGAFTERELELLQSFADQAVIAIGNARLFEAVQAKTSDLEESLEYQTATSDVLQVISRSTFDLQPVLDTLVETAARLCGAPFAHIARPVGPFTAWWRPLRCGPRPTRSSEACRSRLAAGPLSGGYYSKAKRFRSRIRLEIPNMPCPSSSRSRGLGRN